MLNYFPFYTVSLSHIDNIFGMKRKKRKVWKESDIPFLAYIRTYIVLRFEAVIKIWNIAKKFVYVEGIL